MKSRRKWIECGWGNLGLLENFVVVSWNEFVFCNTGWLSTVASSWFLVVERHCEAPHSWRSPRYLGFFQLFMQLSAESFRLTSISKHWISKFFCSDCNSFLVVENDDAPGPHPISTVPLFHPEILDITRDPSLSLVMAAGYIGGDQK